MAKYLDLFTDYGFKKIFGEEANKGFLIDFLNSLLGPEVQVKDLTFKNNEHLGDTPDTRNMIYDISCENEIGEQFIVEVQKVKYRYFLDRTIYYASRLLSKDGEKGEWKYTLKPVYCICLLDFELVDFTGKRKNKVIRKASFKDEDGDRISDKLNLIYIEIPNFKKGEHELDSRLDKWLYFIKNLESFEAIPEIFKNEVVFVDAMHKAEIATMNETDRAKYDADLKIYRDSYSALETAKEEGEARGEAKGEAKGMEKGIEKGIEIGIDKGIKQNKIDMAKKCLKRGMQVADITDLTGLTEEEIKNIEL